MESDHLLFTDWEVTDEGKNFGIVGIDRIKDIIKENLVDLEVFDKDDKEVESSVSPPKIT